MTDHRSGGGRKLKASFLKILFHHSYKGERRSGRLIHLTMFVYLTKVCSMVQILPVSSNYQLSFSGGDAPAFDIHFKTQQ